MKLIPISPQHLHVDKPLPFGLRDEDGRLLLAAGHTIANLQHLEALIAQPLFAEEGEASAWTRRLTAAMDDVIRQGGSIRQVVAVRPQEARDKPRPQPTLTLTEQWLEIVTHLDLVLRDPRAEDWPARRDALHLRACDLLHRRPDASLYHLVYESGHARGRYTARHALLALAIVELAAPKLDWEPAWIASLGCAALLMNIAAVRQQDQLAQTTLPGGASPRDPAPEHPAQGAALLQECGLADALALAVVRLHHEAGDALAPLANLAPERQLARLLRRADLFAAQISHQAGRPPASPVQAAREACLGAGGLPDEIGGALLKAVGLYPPGSFVELASGEIAIVIGRGSRANLPHVATLIGASGTPMAEPLARDTQDRRHAVKGVVPLARVKILPPHERLMAMRP
ncbi:conserved hypothetical protein [Rubrivivax sp. A210]|uniref:HD-GYP domain-containing protein n=1 Tax=Rubrivivax sp. A210 TaxID=2772301 RepID=UPI001917AB1D|nr:hypothetical protein [Rubrivivax sp. A210]CAD5374764.1 conserved hypothetical protein [Rubrivivax sp. A210]